MASIDDYKFVPFEFPESKDGNFTAFLDDSGILRNRRSNLGLTQEDVAKMAGVNLRQYQRLEAGDAALSKSNLSFALSVCAVLLLDPYEVLALEVAQPDPGTLKPQHTIDYGIPEELFEKKKPGRKPIRRDIKTVYVNYKMYSLVIPYEVLDMIGSPRYIKLLWQMEEKRILIQGCPDEDENTFDVPEQEYEYSLLAMPRINGENPISAMGWGDEPYSLDARTVVDKTGERLILIDLNTAVPADTTKLMGTFETPRCLMLDGDDDDVEWDDED